MDGNSATRRIMKTPPIRHTLTFAYCSSLVVAVLIVVVSAAALLFGSAGLYGPDPNRAVGVIEAEAGLQFGLTPTGLAAIIAFQPILTASPLDIGTVGGLLIFSVVCFACLAFFVRGAIQPQRPVASPIAGAHAETS